MLQHLQTYTTSHVRARSREELIDNKPWAPTEEEAARYGEQVIAGRVYFRATHFKAYLEQQRMSNITERRIWAWLREKGAMHHQFNISGRIISCWSVEHKHATVHSADVLLDL